jgi:hypothetical protein
MLKYFSALLFITSLLCFQGCDESRPRMRSVGPEVTGKVGEILVVCETGIWESEIKHYLDTHLTQFIMPYFPDVATFELVHRSPSKFEQGIKRYRNTLFIQIDPAFKKPQADIIRKEDVWAIGQLVVEITGKDYNQVLDACKKGLRAVHEEFDTMEWSRIVKQFNREENRLVQNEIKKNFGVDLALPTGARIVSKRNNFYRIEFPSGARPIEFVGSGTQEMGTVLSGVMIYQYEYKDSSQFILENLLKARDTMLRYNVPHETEGLYMGTQYAQLVYPEGTAAKNRKGNLKGYEMRGMFQFTGKEVHTTGGAFWAFHFVHPTTKKLICVSGYVDAPSTTSWTHYLRELQAVWKSVETVK